jgi:5'-3' exonuclease
MILIDYNAIAISNVVTQKLELDENLIRHMILNSIRMYRKKYFREFGEIVICSDGSKNWRYNAFPQYKAKRKDARKESTIDWKELFRITNKVFDELLEHFPYKVVKHDECEADDVIAVLTTSTQIEFGRLEPVMIISSDKDFGQLQKFSNVRQYSPMLKKEIQVTNPRQQLLELILKGDQADGIPNVLSADDSFTQGIRQTPLRETKIQEIIKDLDDGELLYAAAWYRNYLRNKKLIDLTETPAHLKQEIINKFEEQGDRSANKKKVMNYLIANRCSNLLEALGDFI